MRGILCLLALPWASLAAQDSSAAWKFAVSGDSRNCGDIVMPAIARGGTGANPDG